MNINEYTKLVNPNLNAKDYGTWHQFKDTFPPVDSLKGTTFEVLLDNGDPTFHCVFVFEGNVRIRDYDFNQELLEWRLDDCMDLYWRFVPDPPGNYGYSVG